VVIPQASCGDIEPKLPDQYVQHTEWNVLCVVEETPKKAYRCQLHGEAQPIVIAPLAVDKLMVGIVQMKVPRQIHLSGLSHISTVVGALLSCEKLNRHGEDDELGGNCTNDRLCNDAEGALTKGLRVAQRCCTVESIGNRFSQPACLFAGLIR